MRDDLDRQVVYGGVRGGRLVPCRATLGRPGHLGARPIFGVVAQKEVGQVVVHRPFFSSSFKVVAASGLSLSVRRRRNRADGQRAPRRVCETNHGIFPFSFCYQAHFCPLVSEFGVSNGKEKVCSASFFCRNTKRWPCLCACLYCPRRQPPPPRQWLGVHTGAAASKRPQGTLP